MKKLLLPKFIIVITFLLLQNSIIAQNDNCAGAIAVTVNPDTVCAAFTFGDGTTATQSIPACTAGDADDDIWFSFVATNVDHEFHITDVAPNWWAPMAIEIFSGNCGSLTSLSCVTANTSSLGGFTPGNTYYIRIYNDWTGNDQTFNFCIRTITLPPDDCPQAVVASVNPDMTCTVINSGNTANTTQSMVACDGGDADDDIWYSFVAGSSIHEFDISNVAPQSWAPMVVEVFSGACGSLTSLSCLTSFPANQTGLTSGNTYYFRVYNSWTGNDQSFDLCIKTVTVPTNDDCPQAIAANVNPGMTCTFTTSGYTGFTTQSMPGCNGIADDDVWFSFVATDTIHSIDILNPSGPVDHEVFSGPCGGLTSLGCSYATLSLIDSLTIGDTYYVRVYGTDSASAKTFDLCIQTPTPPITASDCNSAVDVCTDLNFSIKPNGVGAVNEIPASGTLPGNPLNNNPGGSGNSGCLWSNEKHSTWMTINISASGDLEFTFAGGTTQGGYYDWIMYPYNPTACADISANNVAPVRCNWNGGNTGGTGLTNVLPPGGDARNYEPALPVILGEQYIICFSNYSSVSSLVPLQFSGTASVSCIPLPVELISFDANLFSTENGKQKVKLEWSTLTEINNDYFTIEKSSDAVEFESVDVVAGAGNSSLLLTYELLDNNPLPGINYYRLKQTDYDGKESYSKIVAIEASITFSIINVFPVPSKKKINYELYSASDKKLLVEVSDLLGTVLITDTKLLSEGNNLLSLNVSELPKGLYTIKFINKENGLIEFSKIIKE